MTDAIKKKLLVFQIIQFLLLATPVAFILIQVFTREAQSKTRLLIICIVVSLMLILFNLIAKKRLRCVLWIVLVGLIFATKDLEAFVCTMSICTTLDDIVIDPICDYYKTKLIASKVLDERERYERES